MSDFDDFISAFLPPIHSGEIYARCPQCHVIGWTTDDDSEPMPTCPDCGVLAEKWTPGESEGSFDVRLVDEGPVPDPAHHLGDYVKSFAEGTGQ